MARPAGPPPARLGAHDSFEGPLPKSGGWYKIGLELLTGPGAFLDRRPLADSGFVPPGEGRAARGAKACLARVVPSPILAGCIFMFAIIGMVVVLLSVIGGYLMEHGNMSVLFQPAELVIIFGAALGSFIISSPKKLLSLSVKDLMATFTAKERGKAGYLELLLAMNELFRKARREGLIAVESHVNKPEESPIFTKYPGVLKDHHSLGFLCDNFKVYISTGMEPDSLDDLMEIDMETQHKEAMLPSAAITKVADAMPGLGIVAAVLGVVLTMGKISEPPEILGHSIGAALVGTFLGILMSYGFVGPLATNMEHRANEHHSALNVIKTGLLSTVSGGSPAVALEFARRAIPQSERPGFEELEEAIRGAKEG